VGGEKLMLWRERIRSDGRSGSKLTSRIRGDGGGWGDFKGKISRVGWEGKEGGRGGRGERKKARKGVRGDNIKPNVTLEM